MSGLTGSSDLVTVPGQFTSALFEGALHNKSCHEACNVWLRVEAFIFIYFFIFFGYERSGLNLDYVSCESKCQIFNNHLNCHKS